MDIEQTRCESRSSISRLWTPERRAGAKHRTRRRKPPSAVKAPITLPGFDPNALPLTQTLGESPVPDPTKYPWRTVGKLFFSSGGEDWVGTAFVIASDGLMTAAHNLYDENDGWSTNLQFVPAYDDGTNPFGLWMYTKYWVPENYDQDPTESHDVGLVLLEEDLETEKHIGDVVGQLQIQTEFNLDSMLTFIEVGYPKPGTVMTQSIGAYTRTIVEDDKFKIIGKDGELSQGASGGPWLLRDPVGIAYGLTSHSNYEYPGQEFSPYFDKWVTTFVNSHFGDTCQFAKTG